MNRSRSLRGLAIPGAAAILAIVVLMTAVAVNVLGRGGAPSAPAPTDRPAPSPTARPADPTPKPTEKPADGVIKVDLDIATDHDVSVVIDDQTGSLVGAKSGRAGDGMSVRWYELDVQNVDADTLRLTWVGFGQDDEIDLAIAENDGALRLRLVQPVPYPNTDGLGFDRVLELSFAEPVSAEDVQASIQASLDTAD